MTAQLQNITNTPADIKNEWRTPPEVFRWANEIISGFDYDTACTVDNHLAMPIWYDTEFIEGDALSFLWHGSCWCNPPYDNIDPWVNHAIKSKAATTAMLIPSPNGEDRYKELIRNSHEIVIVGRLSFIAGGDYVIKGKNGKPDKFIKEGDLVSGNTRGSSLFIINGYAQGSRSFVERDWIMETFA